MVSDPDNFRIGWSIFTFLMSIWVTVLSYFIRKYDTSIKELRLETKELRLETKENKQDIIKLEQRMIPLEVVKGVVSDACDPIMANLDKIYTKIEKMDSHLQEVSIQSSVNAQIIEALKKQ